MAEKRARRPYTRPEQGYYFERLRNEDPATLADYGARGGLTTMALYGRDAHLGKARAATRARRIALVDPDGRLTQEELEVRLRGLARVHALRMLAARRRKSAPRAPQALTGRKAEAAK